ncbi:PDZ domain-containing protein [Roseiconus nitratireducens]|uniref:PDZ domain-containing protein n=1 Tax=Roseiconus nitratireducens TaxID=2605748 RepID=A0A5M6CZ84_9BACT|nr:S1C family serine protease [Roseiconus nitratireducens]KAA5539322.1 PDZ domain-containing protein [Roseiconus nitratireducens]
MIVRSGNRTEARAASLVALCLVGAWAIPRPAAAQSTSDWLHHAARQTSIAARDSGAMMRLVRPLSESVQRSVVQVFCGGRIASLGTVVAADGYVITKRSELSSDPITVRLPNGEKVAARIGAVRRSNDLALLKIEGDASKWGIEPVNLNGTDAATGGFLVSPGRNGYTVGFGVVGAAARRVDHDGRLGVRFYDTPTGPAMVRGVFPQSGAFDAGLQERDQILKINGNKMLGSHAAIMTLRELYPGEVVRLTIMRGEDMLELDAMMSDERLLQETKNDAKVNGPRNVRLSGFDSVIQHDTVLSPNQCGGPVLDSSGNLVGINIARAGRVVSYALPVSLVAAEVVSMLDESRQ